MKCQHCGNEAEWVSNAEVYGKPYGASYMIWLCRPCDAFVGCHNNTKTNNTRAKIVEYGPVSYYGTQSSKKSIFKNGVLKRTK